MKKLIIGSLLAAVAMFMFGFVYWVALEIPTAALKSAPDTAAAQAALKSAFAESGAYFVPGPDLPEDEFARLHEAGPRAFVHYNADGAPAMSGLVLLNGFIHNWITCFLLALLLLRTNTPTYASRVAFLALAGFTAALFIDYGAVIWFYASREFQLVNLVSNAGSWVVAGLVLAWWPGSSPEA